ncbi:ATP-binding cassette transporter snq2 [Elasticomyces elasticus]|nr:ATP-binding cassette transporter snq2 [Elasticomyces elasticus]
MIMVFELYYVSFGQAIASFANNELFASLLVPMFFIFVICFCGTVVPPAAIPTFWRSWVYWANPFHYMLEGMVGVAAHNLPVVCGVNEFARFLPPPGQSCQSYVAPYIAQAGGYVQNGTGGLCELCQYANGNEYSSRLSIYYKNDWRDFGISLLFVAFNFAVVYLSTYLRFKVTLRNPVKDLFAKRKAKQGKKIEKD